MNTNKVAANRAITRSKKSRSYPRNSRPNGNSNYVTRKQLNGGKFTPPTNPPDVSYQPWWPITVIGTSTTSATVTVESLCNTFKTQVDPNKRGLNQNPSSSNKDNAFRMQIRLLKISAWNLTGRMLALAVEDYTDAETASGGRDQLCGIVDTGTSTHTPACAYAMPISLASHVLRNDDKGGKLTLYEVQAGKDDTIIVYTTMLFRFDGPVSIPTVMSPITAASNEIRECINNESDELNASIERLIESIDKLTAAQPSLVTKLIDGAIQSAAYVAPLVTTTVATSSRNHIIAALREATRNRTTLRSNVDLSDVLSNNSDVNEVTGRDSEYEELGLGEPFA